MTEYQLIIDCKPGTTRPGNIAKIVLEDTGIVLGEPKSRVFGQWTWDIPPEYCDSYQKNKDLIGTRLKNMYETGMVRYAEW